LTLTGTLGSFSVRCTGWSSLWFRVRNEHRGQAIEGDDAVRLRISDRPDLGFLFQRFVVGVIVVQRPWCLAAEYDLVDADHRRSGVQTF